MIRRILFSSDESSENEDERPARRKIYKERVHDFDFKEAFRLNKVQVKYVLGKIGARLAPANRRNHALTAEQQLLLTLHWLGNGAQMHGIAIMHGVRKSTVCRSIKKVVNIIIDTMFEEEVIWPENTQDIAMEFLRKGGFPCVCGCVDGTLINIDSPSNHEEVYLTQIGLEASTIPESFETPQFIEGLNKDGGFFQEQSFWDLGDSAYATRPWLMTPLHRNPGAENERRYNNAHKLTRKLVEDSYGILKEKCPCLNHLRANPEKAARIVLACAILHNVAKIIGREDHYPNREEMNNDNPDEDNMMQENNNPPLGEDTKRRINELLRYFRN
ncbi:putative nuclease HARBI1 [Zophobas morio]|uniref:putative nuclease HARBI1 n=1 Tax=Zophobas morio TaxID=2755281 RepID=UPI00308345DE